MAKKILVLLLSTSSLITSCGESSSSTSTPEPTAPPEETAPAPLREVVGNHFASFPEAEGEPDQRKIELGRALFHDRRLSGDETVSCSTCHMLSHGGAEPRATSTGIRGQVGPINSPTVLNARFNFRQFWDGRAADLLEQAAGPVTNPMEMGGDWETILGRLRADEALVTTFSAIYGDNPVTQENVLDAIVAYENFLVTPSAFDRWLGGDDDALDAAQQRGLRAFVETGCTTCHRGVNLGGDSYQRMGLVNNYFERRGGELTEADAGRFNVTQDEEDRHRFKVPTLRNVALTTPYFHDGSEQNLAGAVRTMAWAQLGRDLEDDTVNDIVAFLGSLTGELPEGATLPGSGDDDDAAAPAEDDTAIGAAPAEAAAE